MSHDYRACVTCIHPPRGRGGAVKRHANNVPQCALATEEVIRDDGAPEGLFRTVLIKASEVAGLIADDRIAAITLTGSSEVGSIVASQAGRALKKQVLELGGPDPVIVLANADVEAAAAAGDTRRTDKEHTASVAA